jgi:PAS domain S-box-containing protein
MTESVDERVVDAAVDLKNTRRALDTARRQLALALDAAGAPCAWEWDIANKRLVGDARFAAMTLQDPAILADGVSTDRFYASIHPEDFIRVKLAVAGILAGAALFSKEYRLLREDGGYRWVQATGRAVLDEYDQPASFVGVLVDITEQKRVSEQLRIAQSAGGIGTFEYHVGWPTVGISDQFCRLFGLHHAKSVSVATLNALTHADDERLIDVSDPRGLENERNIDFRIRRADDGEERWLARRGEFLNDVETGDRRYAGVVFDVTDARRAQDQLRQANDELAGIAREREQFIAVLGHDLRNPLASLSAGLRFLNKDTVDPGKIRVLKLMGESVQRMGNLIDNLLDLARGRLGGGIGLEIAKGQRIEPVLARIVNEIQSAYPERIIETDFTLQQPIDVDPVRLEQMFSNLLANAVTHGAPDEPIVVSAKLSGLDFELSVSNGGVPIPAEVIRRLFQPFYRGEDNPSKQGLGLGLYIAHEIAKAHGGSLLVTSDATQTRFVFTMPMNITT